MEGLHQTLSPTGCCGGQTSLEHEETAGGEVSWSGQVWACNAGRESGHCCCGGSVRDFYSFNFYPPHTGGGVRQWAGAQIQGQGQQFKAGAGLETLKWWRICFKYGPKGSSPTKKTVKKGDIVPFGRSPPLNGSKGDICCLITDKSA